VKNKFEYMLCQQLCELFMQLLTAETGQDVNVTNVVNFQGTHPKLVYILWE